jgi:hypothetical protein
MPVLNNALSGDRAGTKDKPALLVSYVYLKPFLANRDTYQYRDWVMDSGAFSAWNAGKVIHLQDYIDTCKRLLATDPTLVEVYALDVIGDPVASLKNCEEMWRQGVEAIPCFHVGEPWHMLKSMARDYPKIALGGMVGRGAKEKDAFIAGSFGLIWPKQVHGFGLCNEKLLCMESRGVQAVGTDTSTSALRGILRRDSDARREFHTLIGLSS